MMKRPLPSAIAPGVRGSQSPFRGFAPAGRTPLTLCAACAALLAAFTMTLVEINRLDREYELAERV